MLTALDPVWPPSPSNQAYLSLHSSEATLAKTFRACSSPAPTQIESHRTPAILGQESVQHHVVNHSSHWKATIHRFSDTPGPQVSGGRDWRLIAPQWYRLLKFMRFFDPQEAPFLRVRRERQKEAESVSEEEGCASSCFWRDPDAQFCVICGDDKENHLELMCPYNYLSPAAYVPCRARLALWGNYTTTLRYKCPRHKEEEQRTPPTHDETNSRRLTFMRCLVRVNNLPEWYPTEQLVELFSRFGPLPMWYVATRSYGACKGYGCVVFQDHGHAEEAVEALNCWEFGGHKLRVDWAYPCLNC